MKASDTSNLLDARIRERIGAKKRELDGLRPLPKESVAKIRQRMGIDLTYNSNAMEGNTLTLQETRFAIEEGITVGGKPLRYYTEAVNHKKALDMLYGMAKHCTINNVTVQELHETLMKGVSDEAGQYRRRRVYVTGAAFVPPEPEKIGKLMDGLEKWAADFRGHTVEFAALAHHRFVSIHPFTDGNGRTARLIMNLILIADGFPPTILRMTDRKRYYAALRDADRGDCRPLVNFVGRAAEQSLNIYLDALWKPTDKNKLMPLKEASKHSRYSQDYLSLLARRGLIGATKVGRNWSITLDELERYERGHGGAE
jgi:Fic family protein